MVREVLFGTRRRKIASGQVLLEKDVSETDRYGRLLRYVWLVHPDGQRMLNEELVKGGYAQSSSYPPDVKYQDLFNAAEQTARAEGRGLWGTGGGFGVPAEEEEPAAPPQRGGSCDPSYPDVCIPPKSAGGDLDCGDVPHTHFTVLPPDPHRLDGGKDGIGCEGG